MNSKLTLVFGTDEFEIDKFKTKFILEARGSNSQLNSIDGETIVSLKDLNFNSSLDLFGSKHIYLIKNLFRNKSKKILSDILKFLENKSEEIIFIEYPEIKEYGKKKGIDKRNMLYKFLSTQAECFEFEELKPRDFLLWAKRYIASNKFIIEEQALYYLLDRTGYNKFVFTSELKKLSTLGIIKIDVEVISKYVSESKESKIFDLITAITKRKDSSNYINSIIKKPEDYAIFLTLFVNDFSKLYKYQLYQKENLDPKKIFANSFMQRLFLEKYEYFLRKDLLPIYEFLLDIDAKRKRGYMKDLVAVSLIADFVSHY